jgi:hypothetical protein
MTWDNHTCDDCGTQTSGGPVLRDELWGTITTTQTVPVPSDPEQPFLFPIFRYFDSFLCLACIERRLGRQLTQEDLGTPCPWNTGWRNARWFGPFGVDETGRPRRKSRR